MDRYKEIWYGLSNDTKMSSPTSHLFGGQKSEKKR